MKKIILLGFMLGLASAAFAIDFSVEARTDLLYTSYIKNSAYDAFAALQTMTAINVFEKIRLKANAEADSVKFNFDGKIFLKPNDPILEYGIDTAYFSYENGPFVLYAGKQRMKWGTGYFWNPTDNLQPAKDVFRTTEDLEGIVALRAEYSNDIVTPSVILVPDYNADSRGIDSDYFFGLQLYKLIGTCDLFVNYILKKTHIFPGEQFQSCGMAISWDAGFIVLNAEAAAKLWAGKPVMQSDMYDFVVGVSKTMGDAFFNVEYFRRNNGLSNHQYALEVALHDYGPVYNKKNYLAYSVSYTLDQKFAFSITGIHGFDDGTAYLFPAISWVENQNFDVQVSLMENLTRAGMNEGNYSTPIRTAAELRINAYF